MNNVIEWVDMVQQGGAVRRFHTLPTIGSETVAEHSFGVAMLCVALTNGQPTVHLLKAALFHDLAEQFTGDVPAPTKWKHPFLKTVLEGIEEDFEHNYELKVKLSPTDHLVFKWADMLQLLLFCKMQRDMGNRLMNPVFARGVEYLGKLETHENGQKILNWIIENYGK